MLVLVCSFIRRDSKLVEQYKLEGTALTVACMVLDLLYITTNKHLPVRSIENQ